MRWLRWLNLMLALVAVGCLWGLLGVLREYQALDVVEASPSGSNVSTRTQSVKESTTLMRPSKPPVTDFQMLVERDPFKNPQESVAVIALKPELILPVLPPPNVVVPKVPLPPLALSLSGTIVVGEERKAILHDGKQENLYLLGQDVGGGILETIEGDRVVILRGTERTELLMQSAIERTAPPSAAVASAQETERNAKPSDNLMVFSQEKRKKVMPLNKPMFATPAFARYPGANYAGARRQ
jgi:hypothetical protein